MFGKLRPLMGRLWAAPAKGLLRLGVHPNAVTIVGTIGVVFGACFFFPQGGIMLFWGVLFITFFVVTDMLDGTMARLSGKESRLGAYLDSTLDRVADAAIFGALVWTFRVEDSNTALAALLCVTLGSFVPYARARAEGLGIDAKGGIAERSDRLAIGLVATALVGLGLPVAVLTWTLYILAILAAVTVVQRTMAVVRANRADFAPAADAGDAAAR
ncbi:phosphatidylinositol phosphate synthase [Demequina globuliformis]|uniref:phosphatidylinositol phosphate synthase n=1 Tax=Demequina globuliformis TaxID=676202 RepID=UPI000783B9C1|nr:CDP-alcohol phosphatidyltransferase family protein [Demequina globuliformis]